MRRIRLGTLLAIMISFLLVHPGFAASKQIVIRYAGGMSLQHHITKTMEYFAKLVEERTGGQVKIELYTAATLFSHKDLPMAVATGAVDFAELDSSMMGGLSEAAGVSTMSFLFRDWKHTLQIHNDAQKLVDEELQAQGTRLIFWMPYGKDIAPLTVKKQINSLEDLKGLKIRGIGEISSRWLEASGASSTYIASPEVYQALATQAIDGAMSGWGTYYDRKWYEAGKYILGETFNYCMFVTVANLKKWNELPKEVQDIIMQAGEEAQNWDASVVEQKDEEYIAQLKGKGIVINQLSDSERERWRNLMKPIYKEWAARTPGCAKLMELLTK